MELLYFGKWNFLGPRLKNFQRKLSRLEKQKKSYPKIFLIFHEVEFFSPKLKELLFFFLKKLFYFRRGLSENQKFLINKKFLIFSIFFFLKIKSPVFFFQENPLGIFTTVFFFKCFHFSPLFFGVFIVDCIFSGHHFSSPWLFLLLDLFVRYSFFVLLYYECYRLEKAFFTLSRFLPYTPSPHLSWYHKCYRFETDFFYPQKFFTLPSFTTLSTFSRFWTNSLIATYA